MSRNTKLVGLLVNKLEEAVAREAANARTIPRAAYRAAAEKVLTMLQVDRRLSGEAIEQALRPEIAGDERDLILAVVDNVAAELVAEVPT